MKSFILSCLLTIPLLFAGCGEGTVDIVSAAEYQPKIGIFGILMPERPVDGFLITRNFPVNTNLQNTGIVLNNAQVSLSDQERNQTVMLQFDPASRTYYDAAGELEIRHNATYRLEVTAVFAGETLHAAASTTVPSAGLHITGVNRDSLRYRQQNSSGDTDVFDITFERSAGTDFYLYTLFAQDASVQTYVYDNPFEELSEEEVADDLNSLRFNYEWLQNTPLIPGSSRVELLWLEMPFYGRYEIVLFAADRNYKHFLQTFDDVQEEDGNFHAPLFYFEGDAVGVFGSALADTTYVTVLP